MSLQPMGEEGVVIEWRAWRMPEGAQPPGKPEGYGQQAKQYLEDFSRRTGLVIRHPSRRLNTFLAHTGGKYAREKGVFAPYHEAVFEAIWQRDEDVEDVEVLAVLAARCGLEEGAFKEALMNEEYRRRVEQDYALAASRKIWTIPSYLGSRGEIQVHHFLDTPGIEQLRAIL